MTGPEGKSLFCFPRISIFVEGNIEIWGNKINWFPKGPGENESSVYCFPPIDKSVFITSCLFLVSNFNEATNFFLYQIRKAQNTVIQKNKRKTTLKNTPSLTTTSCHPHSCSVHMLKWSTFAVNSELLPSDIIVFTMLPACGRSWRETVVFLNAMWPCNSQWTRML